MRRIRTRLSQLGQRASAGRRVFCCLEVLALCFLPVVCAYKPSEGTTLIPTVVTATVPTEAATTVPPTPTAVPRAATDFYYGVVQPISTTNDIRFPEGLAEELQRIGALRANVIAQVFPQGASLDDFRNYLDVAQQQGFSVLVKIGPLKWNPTPADLVLILDTLEAVGDHPALYSFIYLHEPFKEFETSEIQAMYGELKAAHPDVRLGIIWSGEIGIWEWRDDPARKFADDLCDVCVVNLKPFLDDAFWEEVRGLGRMRRAASIVLERDRDAELWSSAHVWSPPGGGARGFRVPSPAEMETLLCTLRQQYPLRGFLWETWTTDKPNEGALADPALTEQRQCVRDAYDACVQNP